MNEHDNQILQEMEAEIARGEHLYALERPRWGYRKLSVNDFRAHRDALLSQIEAVRQSGGLLGLSWGEGEEQSIITLLLLLSNEIRAQGHRRQIVHPLTHAALNPSQISEGCLLVHHAPRIAGLWEVLQRDPGWWRGRVVIATGLEEEWGRLSMPLPIQFYRWSSSQSAALTEAVRTKTVEIPPQKKLRDLHNVVACLDSLGVPIPLTLLARVLGQEEDQVGEAVEDARGLLFWVEREVPPGLLVCTRGEEVATAALQAQYGEKTGVVLQETLCRVVSSLNPEEPEERHAALNLFESLLAKGRRSWARQLAEDSLAEAVWLQGTPAEILGWGTVLSQLHLFEAAERIFQRGMSTDGLQAEFCGGYAYLLSRWAMADPEKVPQAEEAFAEAVAHSPENAYLRSRWGLMEVQVGNKPEARRFLAQAKDIKPGNAFSLLPAASLALALEDYGEAMKLLERLEILGTASPFALYLMGRAAVGQSRLQEAGRFFRNVLDLIPSHASALVELASAEAKQGHRETAEAFLRQAFEVDPEDGDLLETVAKIRMAEWHDDRGALAHLRRARRICPRNFSIEKAWSALVQKIGRIVWAPVEEAWISAATLEGQPVAVSGESGAAPSHATWVAYGDAEMCVALTETSGGELIATVESGKVPVEGALVTLVEMDSFGNPSDRATGITDGKGEVILGKAGAFQSFLLPAARSRWRVRVVIPPVDGE